MYCVNILVSGKVLLVQGHSDKFSGKCANCDTSMKIGKLAQNDMAIYF